MTTSRASREELEAAHERVRATEEMYAEQVATLQRRLATLEAELERERLRLAACGVAAMAPAQLEGMRPEYDSGSLQDVLRLQTRCVKAEAELDEPTRARLLAERLGFDPEEQGHG